VSQVLGPEGGPVVLVSDWLKALPDLLGRWLPAGYISLGTEGFGRSDTREALRALFEIDAASVALAAITALARRGEMPAEDVAAAIAALGIDPEKMDPLAF
jgi:pyruvate dehydrogenase E1 component